ncbi:DUF2934 domain-containing protein [Methylobacterium phyllosphaerae]
MMMSEHHVRECAYYIWEREGRIHGQAAAHWIRAEAELRANAMVAVKPADATVAAAKPAKPVAAKATASKSAAAKPSPAKSSAAKAVAAKTVAAKTLAEKPAAVKAAAKPAAPKTARASKTAVTAGLAAKAKPARTPASMH